MFNFFKKSNYENSSEEPSFEIELTAAVLAYEIARSDGDINDFTISPGLCAFPLTIFSTNPTTPTALTFAFLKAKFLIRPTTTADPAIS